MAWKEALYYFYIYIYAVLTRTLASSAKFEIPWWILNQCLLLVLLLMAEILFHFQKDPQLNPRVPSLILLENTMIKMDLCE